MSKKEIICPTCNGKGAIPFSKEGYLRQCPTCGGHQMITVSQFKRMQR